MEKRQRAEYEKEYDSQEFEYGIENIVDIKSANEWDEHTIKVLKINVVDVDEMFYQLASDDILNWSDDMWAKNIDINDLAVDNKIKTLINKVRNIYLAKSRLAESYVDGFVDSLLHILGFDDYPCNIYIQHEYNIRIGPKNFSIIAKPDFSVVSAISKMIIVIEDKTMKNANYGNNWKEDQVLGELFVAAHNRVYENQNIKYPIEIYAVRVVGTLFTFFKADVTLEYIKETAKHLPITSSMIIQRHPKVIDDPSKLTAYDFCKVDDRIKIINSMNAIKSFLTTN